MYDSWGQDHEFSSVTTRPLLVQADSLFRMTLVPANVAWGCWYNSVNVQEWLIVVSHVCLISANTASIMFNSPETQSGLVYTSYKREGESVFAFPEGCPEGGPKGAKRAGPC